MKKLILIPIMILLFVTSVLALSTSDYKHYYKLDSSSGITAIDSYSSINLYSGNTTALWVTGKINNGMDFERDWQMRATNASTGNFTAGGSISMDAWIKLESLPPDQANPDWPDASSMSIVMKQSVDAHVLFGMYIVNISGVYKLGCVRNREGAGTSATQANVNFNVSQWYYVAITYNVTTNNCSIYLNSVNIGSKIFSAGNGSGAGEYMSIGSGSGSASWTTAYFDGIIDEVGITNKALSQAEINSRWNAGNGLSYPFVSVAPTVDITTLNLTTAVAGENSTAWRGGVYNQINVLDSTPTITFSTDTAAYCRINKATMNYTTMTSSRNCTTTGGLNHICTLAAADALQDGLKNQHLVVACADLTETLMNVTSPLNLSYTYSMVQGGIFNTSLVNVTTGNISEGQEFYVWANLSWLVNSSSLGDDLADCSYNMNNVSIEYYSSDSANETLCLGGACAQSNKTVSQVADTNTFLMDTFRSRLCRNSATTPDAKYIVRCAGGVGINGTITASTIPLCAAGYKNVTIDSTACVGASTTVNVSIWTTGNTLAKGYTIVNKLVGFDRYRNEVNKDLLWSPGEEIWRGITAYEYYTHGTKFVNITCNDTGGWSLGQNVSFYVVSRNPGVLFNYIADWFRNETNFVNGVSMFYPLFDGINTSVFCVDESAGSYSVNLTFENGTVIYGRTGSGSPGTHSWGQSNFSTSLNYINGILGYDLDVLCIGDDNLTGYGSRRFYATNTAPTVTWVNASGGAYSGSPSFSFTYVDTEEASGACYAVLNDTLNQTFTPVVSGAVSVFSKTYVDGSYNLSVVCADSFRNSSTATLLFTKSTACIFNITGLVDGARYMSVVQPVVVACSNGVSITSCSYTINDYAALIPSNCSGFNMTLLFGGNKIKINATDAVGVSTLFEVQVFALKENASVGDFMPMIVLLILTVLLVLAYVAFGMAHVFALLVFVAAVVLGWNLVGISLWAAIVVWIFGFIFFIYALLK